MIVNAMRKLLFGNVIVSFVLAFLSLSAVFFAPDKLVITLARAMIFFIKICEIIVFIVLIALFLVLLLINSFASFIVPHLQDFITPAQPYFFTATMDLFNGLIGFVEAFELSTKIHTLSNYSELFGSAIDTGNSVIQSAMDVLGGIADGWGSIFTDIFDLFGLGDLWGNLSNLWGGGN